ncbi:MAG: phytase [Gemmatimonadota bacterium]
MTRLAPAAVAALAVAWACGGGAAPRGADGAATSGADVRVVEERWLSVRDTLWDVDTPALWHDGTSSIVLVTGKGTHDLQMFDGSTGERLGALGRQGTARGDFDRPNGVIVVGDYALVVERDNHRVQVLGMPDGASLGTFGASELRYPYGLAAYGTPDDLTVWVTDDYEDVEDVVPDDLTKRLHRFEVALYGRSSPDVLRHRTYGERRGPGSLRVVESIQVDPETQTVFVADESRRSYLEYDGDGTYRGRALGAGDIAGDPEGLVLVRCGADAGYWVATDQQEDVTLFRVYDRVSLDPVAVFRGAVTANTDGTTFAPGPVPGFPDGVLYAVHDDQAISAFDWADVTRATGLRGDCGRW